MPFFSIYIPKDLDDALEFLSKHAPEAVPLAGGTDLLVLIREGKLRPKYLVDLSGLRKSLSYVAIGGSEVRVGALTTINKLASSPLTKLREFAGFNDLCRTFGNAAVRSLATVGGNIGAALSASDLIVMFKALDAEVKLESVRGARYVSIHDLVVEKRTLAKEPDEVITEVKFRGLSEGTSSAYIKFDYRDGTIIGLVSVAAVLRVREGKIEDVRLAFDRVSRRIPDRAYLTERMLRGRKVNESDISEVIEEYLPKEMRRKSDYRASAEFRLHISKVLARRAILLSYTRIKGGE